jgi:hypothetical protein
MNSALRLILGVSVLSLTVGCDNGTDDGGTAGKGPVAVAGSASSAAGTATSAAGTTADPGGGASAGGMGGVLPTGVPITATDGWVDGPSNTLGIQGAMFSYSDDTSGMGLVQDFMGADACIKGTAAKVDLKCTPMAPAVDCYGQFWGAAIGLNLNQPTVMMGGMAIGGDPMPFDASTLKGFAFEITGAAVPTSLRFKIENSTGEFCSPPAKPVKLGANTFMFSDLLTQCWKAGGTSAESAKSSIVKIAWQVVTNDKSAVPFDYCVANVRALQ